MKIALNHWKMHSECFGSFTCKTPCSLYGVLIENKVIAHPYIGCNEQKYYDVADGDVLFTAEFDGLDEWMQSRNVEIVFEGIDTLAEVRLNGNKILNTDNMHRRYLADIKRYVVSGKNTLEVHIQSPTAYMDAMYAKEPVWSVESMYPGNPYLRKAYHMGGWDWGPRMLDMGIWKPVYIDAYDTPRIKDFEIRQIHGKDTVALNLSVDLTEDCKDLDVVAEFEGKTYAFLDRKCTIVVENPKLWWVNGLGDQNLYDICFVLKRHGKEIDRIKKRIGLRTLELSRDYDEWGREFCFKLNGKKIFAKGANYIPEKNILSEICYDDTYQLLKDSKDANFNCIRVWGGGYYPGDDFFDICDEIGIIVWQDFMFACTDINLSEALLETISVEAEQFIKRVRHHASLGLLCGNNEIEESMAYWERGLPNDKMLADYKTLFYKTLPSICSRLAPDIFYWPSSPSTEGKLLESHDQHDGDNHVWTQWNVGSSLDSLREDYSRFCSEFGIESFASMDALRSVISDEQMDLFTDEMDNHQKAGMMGTAKILRYIGEQYGLPKTFDKIAAASQFCQAEGLKYTFEHYRRNRGRCMGVLYWQLNDIWPVASWSSVDSLGKWKPVHYIAKRCFAPIHLSVYTKDAAVRVHISNETLKDFSGHVSVYLKDMDFNIISDETYDIDAKALSADCDIRTGITEALMKKRKDVFVEAVLTDCGGNRVSVETLVVNPPRKLKIPKAKIQIDIKKNVQTAELYITSDRFVRNAFIDIPGEVIAFSDNYFDITSDKTILVTFDTALTEEQIKERVKIISDADILSARR